MSANHQGTELELIVGDINPARIKKATRRWLLQIKAGVDYLEAAAAGAAASEAAAAAGAAEAGAAGSEAAGAGAATGAGAGAGAASSFLPQADRAAAAMTAIKTSDLFI